MAGVPAFERDTYAADIRNLKRRGLTIDQIAAQLGMSRATVYRILAQAGRAPGKH